MKSSGRLASYPFSLTWAPLAVAQVPGVVVVVDAFEVRSRPSNHRSFRFLVDAEQQCSHAGHDESLEELQASQRSHPKGEEVLVRSHLPTMWC